MPQTLNFSVLTPADAQYLLDLINEIDYDIPYTARQRGYTVPKLEQIAKGTERRLAYQDVCYLLELLKDDDAPEYEQQKLMARDVLQGIKNLQEQRAKETQSIEEQRALRRTRRMPAQALQEHFQHTSA